MRGSKAKEIRRLAKRVVQADGVDPMEGYNDYNQETNCNALELALGTDGLPLKDEDGQTYLMPVKRPGTIHLKWKMRLIYKALKRLWRQEPTNIAFQL